MAGRELADFEGEPRDVAGERSALACFQWGLLGFRAGRMARAIDWAIDEMFTGSRAIATSPDSARASVRS